MDYCSQLWQAEMASICVLFGLKRAFLELDIVWQNVPYKTNYWTKIDDLCIIFLRRSCLIHGYYSYCIHILWEVCRFVFYGPPCIVQCGLKRKPRFNPKSIKIENVDIIKLISIWVKIKKETQIQYKIYQNRKCRYHKIYINMG